MDTPRYTIRHNFDDPTTELVFNNKGLTGKGAEFPLRIYSSTAFDMLLVASKWNNIDDKTDVEYDFTGFTNAQAFIKPANSIISPTLIATGSTTATSGEMLFSVDKDIIPPSFAQYTTPANPTPIVIYLIIEDGDKKISLETNVAVMDITRNGTEDATPLDAGGIGLSVEQPAKWTVRFNEVPLDVQRAIDLLGGESVTDKGVVISILSAQPGSPVDGDRYLSDTTAGDWTAEHIHEWNTASGTWTDYTPKEGDEVYDTNTSTRLRFNGTSWLSAVADSLPVDDTTSLVQDPVDNTKQARLDVGAVSTATVRTITVPDQDIDLTPGTGSFIKEIVSDTTPQLGGDLDVNGNDIISVAAGDIDLLPDTTGRVNTKSLTVLDGTDTTKKIDVDLSAVTTATTRQLILPDRDVDLENITGANVKVGLSAGKTTQGASAVAIGNQAGETSQGVSSVAIGINSGLSNQGSSSVAVGNLAGSNAQNNGAVAIGVQAGQTSQGTSTVAVGNQAGQNSLGSNAVAVGYRSLQNATGADNTAIGYDAGQNNTTGADNVFVGHQAGKFISGGVTANQTSTNSLYIGNDTKANANGNTNEIVIGDNVTGAGSNTVTIGNTSIVGNYFNGGIYMQPMTAPANPASGFVLYVDSADGDLKAKASTGVTTTLANN